MKPKRNPPFSKWPLTEDAPKNHVRILVGPGTFDKARQFCRQGNPSMPVPENADPSLYEWPVMGMEVTVLNYGTSVAYAESMVYELLKAGAKLVVHVDTKGGLISIHRPEGLTDAI